MIISLCRGGGSLFIISLVAHVPSQATFTMVSILRHWAARSNKIILITRGCIRGSIENRLGKDPCSGRASILARLSRRRFWKSSVTEMRNLETGATLSAGAKATMPVSWDRMKDGRLNDRAQNVENLRSVSCFQNVLYSGQRLIPYRPNSSQPRIHRQNSTPPPCSISASRYI